MERKATIVWDFDGVLAEAGKWEGHKKIGPPREKWLNVLRKLHADGYTHHISTCRLNPYLFGSNKDPDLEVITGKANRYLRMWLHEQKIAHIFSEVTGAKVYGDLYIDDRMPLFSVLDDTDDPEDIYKVILDELEMRKEKIKETVEL
jgi:hypothetical protein